MSKPTSAPSKQDKEAMMRTGATVAVPALPKLDEKIDRRKWCQDYDKVESDLLRNHLAGASESTTLGLRFSPLEFDRRLPDPAEPTNADRMEALRSTMRKAPASSKAIQDSMMSTMFSGSTLPPRSSSTDPYRSLTSPGGGGNGAEGDRSSNGNSPSRRRRERTLSPLSVTRSMTAMQQSLNLTLTSSTGGAGVNTSTSSALLGGGGDPLKNLNKCVRILDTLLDPPAEFRDSFKLNLDGIDLTWMWQYAADRAPQQLLTLDTMRDDAPKGLVSGGGGGVHGVVLNSPRSVVVMLRNGINTGDLIQRTRASFYSPSATSNESAELAFQHSEERRRAMLQSLRQEYREICACVPLHELISSLLERHKAHLRDTRQRASPISPHRSRSALSGGGAAGGDHNEGRGSPTGRSASVDFSDTATTGFAAERRAKMERLSLKNKEKLRKQVEALEAFKHEVEHAQKRRAEAEKMILARELDRKKHLEERASLAAKHFSEMREKVTLFNVAHLTELEKKRNVLESKEAARLDLIRQQKEQKQAEIAAKAAAKQQRWQENRDHLQNLHSDTAARQAERDQRSMEKRHMLEQRRAQEQEELETERRKAAAHRAEAIERARQKHEEELQRAAEREQKNLERVAAFRDAQRAQHEAAHEIEAAREQKRKAAIALAAEKAQRRKEQLEEKRREHERSIELTALYRHEDDRRRNDETHVLSDDKQYLVGRQAKANEFKKLLNAVRLLEKRDLSNEIDHQKRIIAELTQRERDAARREKDAAAAKLLRL